MDPQHISQLLQITTVPEQAKQELIQQKVGEEGLLEVALKSNKISKAPIEDLKGVLRLVMIKVGLRSQNWPAEEEKAVLIEHIFTNFGGNTVAEIKLAFDMAIAGKLELKRDEVNCYENFSCAYFSRIMMAYRLWAADAYRQIHVETPEEQKIFTQEELDDSAREDAERQYQLFLKGHELRNIEINKEILIKDNLLLEGEGVIEFFTRRVKSLSQNIYIKAK